MRESGGRLFPPPRVRLSAGHGRKSSTVSLCLFVRFGARIVSFSPSNSYLPCRFPSRESSDVGDAVAAPPVYHRQSALKTGRARKSLRHSGPLLQPGAGGQVLDCGNNPSNLLHSRFPCLHEVSIMQAWCFRHSCMMFSPCSHRCLRIDGNTPR